MPKRVGVEKVSFPSLCPVSLPEDLCFCNVLYLYKEN